jgi:hypothetical protein
MITWEQIHQLLHVNKIRFNDQKEMDMFFDYMVDLANRKTASWIEVNRYHVLYEWERLKEDYRLKLMQEKRKRKKLIEQLSQ